MKFDMIPWQSTRYPGISVHFYTSDQRTKRVLALIQMEPGCGYPSHKHRSKEEVLVLRGSYEDELGSYATGQHVEYEANSEHSPRAKGGPDDEPCVLLALAHEGIKLLR